MTMSNQQPAAQSQPPTTEWCAITIAPGAHIHVLRQTRLIVRDTVTTVQKALFNGTEYSWYDPEEKLSLWIRAANPGVSRVLAP